MTWRWYILKEYFKTFFIFLGGFYALYIIIDYANQMGSLRQHQVHFSFSQWMLYYIIEFLHRADVLIPFATLLATMKTLLHLNTYHELTALLCGGISLKTVLRPFIIIGLLMTGLLYANAEWGQPWALGHLKIFHAVKHKSKKDLIAQEALLKDGSRIIYQSYDNQQKYFEDVYWVRSFDKIIRMQKLFPYESPPKGLFVEHLDRNNGAIMLSSFLPAEFFPDIAFASESLSSATNTPELFSLSALWTRLPSLRDPSNHKEALYLTALYQKTLFPWLCLLAVISIAPLCVKFSRKTPIFLIYATGIFGLVAFYLLLDAATVVSKRQLFSPLWALGTPLCIAYLFAGWRYYQLR